MAAIEEGIIAHRGGAATAPENTMASFRQAASNGIKWIETDISLLADKQLIICHDPSVDRCSNGSGQLADMTLNDIAKLDNGGWFGPEFTGETFPLLAPALREVDALGLSVNLEFKIHANEAADLVPRMMECLRNNWSNPERLLISSFHWDGLRMVRDMDPDVRIGLLMHALEPGWQELSQEINAYSIHADHKCLNAADVAAVKDAGLALYIFTPNDPEAVSKFWDLGIDAVITDDPLAFRQAHASAPALA
ncbi:glycerophosphodiester phosphodiesterase family protein [Aestuariispira insulae]|uniref:Glycerophosphoryl diester phosphodiesterase n=1 Tax=Aestuariispira insulae TaxID=1461337 RepID=A0A3D9HWL0_9PROT|nr:glycerophosphodiester phosphodiesterase family protein [Aestuariispira insulae]RED53894.1 glycerophosphoryl diester phosphodiesterase [Aestuariispira insulae]